MTTLSTLRNFKSIFSLNASRCFRTLSNNSNRQNPSIKYLLKNAPLKLNYSPIRNKYTDKQIHTAKTWCYYFIALTVCITGLGFASVPLFSAYCQVSNYAGTVNIDFKRDKTKSLQRVEDRELTILFNADKSSLLQWNFQPLQSEVKVAPGETVLAFYTAQNPTDNPISGISTYNVVPYEAGQYFNKIQCFCFDEQQLNPHEQVDMPVFFYIDPEIVKDPVMQNVDTITLSYTFFEALEGLDLPFVEKEKL